MNTVVRRGRGTSQALPLQKNGAKSSRPAQRLAGHGGRRLFLVCFLCTLMLSFLIVPLYFFSDPISEILEPYPTLKQRERIQVETDHTEAVEEREPDIKSVYTVSYIMPVGDALDGAADASTQNESLLKKLFTPLVARESALCYQQTPTSPSQGSATWKLHAIVATRVSPSSPALAALLAEVKATPVAPLGEHLLPSDVAENHSSWQRWQRTDTFWSLDTATLRRLAGLETKKTGDTPHRCYADAVTLVSIEPNRATTASAAVDEPVFFLESYVAAALRSPAAALADYFLVVPSHIIPTRAPYTVFGNETRLPPHGFVESMLMTATQRNKGRVAAVQCAILAPRHTPRWRSTEDTATSKTNGEGTQFTVPVPISKEQLSSFTVVDRGGFVASSAGNTQPEVVLPFLTRRYAGLRGSDQRVLFEEPTGAASLHCGLFHKGLYDEVGGFAAALANHPTVLPADSLSNRPERARTIHFAADSAGWKLSLHMQRIQPFWQVYASRAVGVWRWAESGEQSMLETALQICTFALTDAYGQENYRLLQLLQARRFGIGWQQRLEPLISLRETGTQASTIGAAREAAFVGHARPRLPEPFSLPPILTYSADYPCACCGLGREASGYIQPLMDRYTVSAAHAHNYCWKPGTELLSMAYAPRRPWVFGNLSLTEDIAFWQARARERAQVNFLHSRAPNYKNLYELGWVHRGADYTMTIGRSLSEFSNLPQPWVTALRSRSLTDQLWVTGRFFQDIYRNAGVADARIRIVPEAVDTYEHDPANIEPLPMPFPFEAHEALDSLPHLTREERQKRYIFLSTFKWEYRKGWDILLSAYYDAFGPNAPAAMQNRTTLILKVRLGTIYSAGLSIANMELFLKKWAHSSQNIPNFTGLDVLPHVIFIGSELPNEALLRLYKTVDAFVLPSRAEGWGLPVAEAMTMGLPVITTAWGGLTGYTTNETTYGIPIDGLEDLPQSLHSVYGYNKGKQWSIPSRKATADLMSYVVTHPTHAREVGRRARRHMMEQFSEETVADRMDREIARFFHNQ